MAFVPLSPVLVASAIRLLLDREPLQDAEVEALASLCPDLPALRRHLLASEEFERRHPDLARSESSALVVATLDGGVRVVVDLADHAVGVPIARRTFERNELAFVSSVVRPGQHVIDAGAHAGLYALTMGRLVGPTGSVWAFEPMATQAGWLELGIRENGADGVVHLERTALTDRAGDAEMVVAERSFDPGAARLRGRGAIAAGQRAVRVRTAALDDVAIARPIAFMRLDVEGAEALALRGASRVLAEDRPVLLVEVHADLLSVVSGDTATTLIAWMRDRGYRAHALGAGTAGLPIDHVPSTGVHPVVFLP